MKHIIDRVLFKTAKLTAKKEYDYWETVNAKKGRKQCFNTINSCMIGVLGEFAAKLHLEYKLQEELKYLILNGIEERKTGKYFAKSDITFQKEDRKDYNIEVKGITKGQQRGQILPYHNRKYKKNGVDFVFFIEIYYDMEKEYAECEVYLIEKPEDIEKWQVQPNKFKKECYTHPKYFIH